MTIPDLPAPPTTLSAESAMIGLEWQVAEKMAEVYFKGDGAVFDFLALDMNLQDDFHAMARVAIDLVRRSSALDELGKLDWQDQRAGKPEGYTLDRENHHGDGSVRGISNGKS